VIDGHRRLSAAITAGLDQVPCDLAADRAGDLAGQYLDMVTTSRHREQLRPIEEADALFAAHQAGASRTRMRKTAGLTPGEVTAALAAGKLTGLAREAAAARDLTLDELVILAEFDGDEAAVTRLTRAAAGRPDRVRGRAHPGRAGRPGRAAADTRRTRYGGGHRPPARRREPDQQPARRGNRPHPRISRSLPRARRMAAELGTRRPGVLLRRP